MRALLNIVLAGVAVIALPAGAVGDGADGTGEVREATGGWSIHGGPVEWRPGEPVTVIGRFAVRSPLAGLTVAAAPLQGGACLVADLRPLGIGRASCTTNADCNGPDAIDRERDPRLADYVGYCAARDGSGESPKCWTRPGPAATHCRRSMDGLQLTNGTHELGPVEADPLGNGAPYPEWAVYACMAHEGYDRSCGEAVSPHRQVSLTRRP